MSEQLRKEQLSDDVAVWLGDCREVLPLIGRVDAVVTDPPYGISYAASPIIGKGRVAESHDKSDWDAASPEVDIFEDLMGISTAQIIWGGNYFNLPQSRGWLSWFKPDAPPSMGNFELAWTSLNRTTRQLTVTIAEVGPERVGHPTQKPLRLMEWCLGFVPQARSILDPFMGSGTTGVACVNLGRSFIGIEREERYFDIACRRISDALSRPRLPLAEPIQQPKQEAFL